MPTDFESLNKKWVSYNTALKSMHEKKEYLLDNHENLMNRLRSEKIILQDSDVAEKLLEKFKKAHTDIDIYEKKFKNIFLNSENNINSENKLNELKKARENINLSIYDLSIMLGDKYKCAYELTKQINTKINYITKAYQCSKIYWKIEPEISEKIKMEDPNCTTMMRMIENTYFVLCEKEKIKDPISKLFSEALSSKNINLADIKFEQAFNLAVQTKDLKNQFLILKSRGENYSIKLKMPDKKATKNEVQAQYELIRTISNFYIEAGKINYDSNDNLLLVSKRQICIELFRYSKIFYLMITTYPCLKHESQIQEALVKDAAAYSSYAVLLSKQINYQISDEYAEMNKALKRILQELLDTKAKAEIASEMLKKKQDEEINHQLKLQNEYKEKFHEILKSFASDEDELDQQIKSSDSAVHYEYKDEMPNQISEPLDGKDEELKLIEVTEFSNNTHIKQKFENINLEVQAENLNQAIAANDVLQQIKVYINIAEYHFNEANRIIKLNSANLPDAIDKYETTKNNLKSAIEKFIIIKKTQTYDQLLEQMTLKLLDDCKINLQKTIAKQKRLKEQLALSAKEAREYIIHTYGKEAWFKFDDYNFDDLSAKAQNRWRTKENITRMSKLKTNLVNLKIELQQQDVPSIAATEFHQQDALAIAASSDVISRQTASNAQGFYANPANQGILLFNPPPLLSRSHSFNSYFSLSDRINAEEKRQSFGRSGPAK